jgi:HEAT repeat protein
MTNKRLPGVVLLLIALAPCRADEALYAGKPLAFWLDELESRDPFVREEAVVVLSEAGPAARAAVPRLEALTKDEHRRLRLRAGLALWRIAQQKKPAIAALTEALRDPTMPERLELLRTLVAFGPEAVPSASTILELVGDADSILATQAVQMLPKLGPGIVPVLMAELEHKDVRRRRHAGEVLARMDASAAEARPALLRGLGADDKLLRTACARALWKQGQTTEAVAAALLDAVRSSGNVQRRRILDTVGYGYRSKRGAPILKELLRGGELLCRVQAARELHDLDPQPETVLPIYVEGLKSDQLGTRMEAAKGLTRLGPAARAALPELIEVLKRPDSASLNDVHSVLAFIDAPAVPPLIELLTSGKADPRLSAAVMNVLSRIGAPAMPAILPLLSDRDAKTRAVGCRLIIFMGPAGKDAVAKLTPLLQDNDVNVRRASVNALGSIGPAARSATPGLIELSHDKVLDLRLSAMKALEQVLADPKRVRPLVEKALQDDIVLVRVRAVSLLWYVAPKDPQLLTRVLELLKQRIGRPELLDLLGRMGPAAARAVPELTKLLTQREPGLRSQVLKALAGIGADARSAVPAMVDLLPGENVALRQAVLRALVSIGSDDSTRIVPAVLETAKKDSTYTRTMCLNLLGQHGRKAAAAVPWLVAELHRPANNDTIPLIEALRQIDAERARKEALPVLRNLLVGPSSLRMQAAGELLRLQPENKEALTILTDGLQGKDDYTRQQAGQALATLGMTARAAVPALRRALRDPSVMVRIHAAEALYKIAGDVETAVPVLIEVLKSSPVGAFARRQAAEKLGDMGPTAKAALPALRALREDADKFVRDGVLAAIQKIDAPPPASQSKP